MSHVDECSKRLKSVVALASAGVKQMSSSTSSMRERFDLRNACSAAATLSVCLCTSRDAAGLKCGVEAAWRCGISSSDVTRLLGQPPRSLGRCRSAEERGRPAAIGIAVDGVEEVDDVWGQREAAVEQARHVSAAEARAGQREYTHVLERREQVVAQLRPQEMRERPRHDGEPQSRAVFPPLVRLAWEGCQSFLVVLFNNSAEGPGHRASSATARALRRRPKRGVHGFCTLHTASCCRARVVRGAEYGAIGAGKGEG
eukprot:scaffold201049_cov33-Tisochrysis_lutea.AAC.1